MATVEAEGLTRRYGSVLAVDQLTFAVEEGRILGVLGPNGAGKTTAIRILTTILRPSSGRFAVAGVAGTRERDVRARIGVLPESAGYPARETAEEYLAYHARLHGRRAGEASATARGLLAEVGLAGRARALIQTYSRGMRQRLGIARALVNDPAVVFLDEPTLGLDPQGQRDVLDMVGRMASERGVTVLLCTHLLDEVEQVCSDVLILNHGRVAALGPVGEVVRRAAAPRSARLRTDPAGCDTAIRVLGALDAVSTALPRRRPPRGGGAHVRGLGRRPDRRRGCASRAARRRRPCRRVLARGRTAERRLPRGGVAVSAAWTIVARRELADLWLRGRGFALLVAYSVLLSATTYLVATNQAINFIEQREAVGLTLQVAVAVGALLSMLAAADAVSGERDRGSLETLLLAPIPRWQLLVGKGVSALSLWLAAFAVAIPYVWFLGHGIDLVAVPLTAGLVVGTLLAVAFAGLGLAVSSASATSRVSLAVCMLVLLALYVPTQFPVGATTGWLAELLQRFNPLTAGLHFLGRLVIDGQSAAEELSWLAAPLVFVVAAVLASAIAAGRLRLSGVGE